LPIPVGATGIESGPLRGPRASQSRQKSARGCPRPFPAGIRECRIRAEPECGEDGRMNCDVKGRDLRVTCSRATDGTPPSRQFTSPAPFRYPAPIYHMAPRAPDERIADLVRIGSAIARGIRAQEQVPDCTPIRGFFRCLLSCDAIECLRHFSLMQNVTPLWP
jgi:hypothetical protein